ncbi:MULTISPECIES: hypothetical protein [unclassified Undibacterium]|uniref:hypothetical protein n=1 Tax=unclassified Undibacterium TaxID=2630295 RepID=UPI002AC8DA87|nr:MULTISPECIES: hypothetical protein [unclassified Undibacterium]MEB0141199.1 hypothetical protein [Undibacterium sp. CCC2.1]MEB0174254.1 hypothetical protein [Undibacterium sp. CCC1.1]MEB0178197.1 hypothetical protein [Undibacterium sp. CCC3.4]MEB0217403.1 hypothetical protein [Undibacterium sp. 5I2]WPX43464.1 hypothetical protein RHM61_19165 [Undibacterium sp. CCC3.4]
MFKLGGTLGFPKEKLALPDHHPTASSGDAAVFGSSALQQANNVPYTVSAVPSPKPGKRAPVSKLKDELLAVNKTELLPQAREKFLAPRTKTQVSPASSKLHPSVAGPMRLTVQTAQQRDLSFAKYLDSYLSPPVARSVAARATLVSLLNSINIDPQNRAELDEAQFRVLLFCDQTAALEVTTFTSKQMRSLNDAIRHNYVKNILKEGAALEAYAEAFLLYGKLSHPSQDIYRQIAKAYAAHLIDHLDQVLPNSASDMASARARLDSLRKANDVLRDADIGKKHGELSDKIHRHYAGQCMYSEEMPKLDRLREAYSAQQQIVACSPRAEEELFQIKLHYAHELLKCRVESAEGTQQAQIWREDLSRLKREIQAERPDLLLLNPELA